MSDELDAARLTRVYRKIRDAIADNDAAHAKRDAELREQLRTVELSLLNIMNLTNNFNLQNEHGSVTRTVKERFWSTDWDEFKKFVKQHDALDLYEHRIAQKNMAEFLKANPDKIPAGLQVDRRYAVRVVKPRSKPE